LRQQEGAERLRLPNSLRTNGCGKEGRVALSAFDDGSHPPGPGELETVLGPAAPIWEQLVARVVATHAPVTEAWNFAGARWGWSLRLKRKDRIVLYMTPQPGQIMVGVVLGEKAARAAADSGLPDHVLALVESAPRYAEGRGIRLTIATRDDVDAVCTLVALKMAA
jgi:hypothetical protein